MKLLTTKTDDGQTLDIDLCRPGRELELEEDNVWEILEAVDNDFVPPLSSRVDVTGRVFTLETLWGGPITVFDEVMKQHVLMASIDGKRVGLMSFIPDYTEDILRDCSPSTYVTIIGVLPRFRRRGVEVALNRAIFSLPADVASEFITRRNWSTNYAYVQLLISMGFEEVTRFPNDRGPGVDTVYFSRRTSPSPFEETEEPQ